MVKESFRNALIGLFVMASLASLATLLVMFGETPTWLGGHEWRLTITGLREIRGIGEGTPVYLNGVEVGRVQELVFANVEQPGLGVHVIAGIKDQYSVPSDSVARLYGAALGIGSGQVQIFVPEGVSPTGNMAKVNAKIPGEMASPYGELIPDDFVDELQRTVSMVGAFADSAIPVAANLALLLEQRTAADVDRPTVPGEEVQANLSTVIERLDRLMANINTVAGDEEVKEDVIAIVGSLKIAAVDFSDLLIVWRAETERLAGNLDTTITRTDQHLDKSFMKLTNVLENLDDSTKRLTVMMDGVADGKGTAGLLLRDDRLYEAGVLALLRLADVVDSVGRITAMIEEEKAIPIAARTSLGTFRTSLALDGGAGGGK